MTDPQVSPEPDLDPTDPYVREAQTFPRLASEMTARIAAYGTEEQLAKGTFVFERGQRTVDFFVVLGGTIEVFDVDPHGEPNMVRIHIDRPEHLMAGAYIGPDRVRELAAGVQVNTDDNMHVEFRAPLDMLGIETTESLERHLMSQVTPVEAVLADPTSVLASADSLSVLIDGRHRLGITAEAYEELLAGLRGER